MASCWARLCGSPTDTDSVRPLRGGQPASSSGVEVGSKGRGASSVGEAAALRQQIEALRKDNEKLRAGVAKKDATIASKDAQIAQRDADIADKDAEITRLRRLLDQAALLKPDEAQSSGNKSFWERNEGPQLEAAMQHVRLIKVTALIEHAERQATERASGKPVTPMPRCQDWDPSAVADANELKQYSKEHKKSMNVQVTGLPIVVLSICWLDAGHPDRLGEQLARLVPILRVYAAAGPFAVMWDYCSLPQKKSRDEDDRTPAQKATFSAGLKTINVWYVHRLTTVILVTSLPAGAASNYSNVTAYSARGWTSTERALSSIVKSTSCLFDAAKLDDEGSLVEEDLEKLVAKRRAPIEPEKFCNNLREGVESGAIRFTAKGDIDIVSKQYRRGFRHSLEETEGIYYASLGWDDEEIASLADSLARCPESRLKRLRLQNKLGDRAADLLANALERGHLPALEQLKLTGNRGITEAAKARLRAVWKEKQKGVEEELQLDPPAAAVVEEAREEGRTEVALDHV